MLCKNFQFLYVNSAMKFRFSYLNDNAWSANMEEGEWSPLSSKLPTKAQLIAGPKLNLNLALFLSLFSFSPSFPFASAPHHTPLSSPQVPQELLHKSPTTLCAMRR